MLKSFIIISIAFVLAFFFFYNILRSTKREALIGLLPIVVKKSANLL